MAKGTDIVKSNAAEVIPERIQAMIHIIRGERVILDRDLAALYQVPTGRLNEAVKRNIKRFPEDFMFQLTAEEMESWKSQIAITNSIKMGLRHKPYAFTENGVAMLSSVLTSEVAINTNIQIMRAFTMMRRTLSAINQTAMRQDKLEVEVENLRNYVENILHDQNDMNEDLASQVEAVSQSLAELSVKVEEVTSRPAPKRAPIGYEAIAEREEE